MTTTDQQAAVDAFNAAHPVGTMVNYWRGIRQYQPSGTGRTTKPAELLSGHTAVVRIDAATGVIALTHVEVVPEQPDGIEDDDREIPEPRRAAERVAKYIEAMGDGLYDVRGGVPLYGRDLEALARAVLAEGATR